MNFQTLQITGLTLAIFGAVARGIDTMLNIDSRIETMLIIIGGIIIFQLGKIIEILEKQK